MNKLGVVGFESGKELMMNDWITKSVVLSVVLTLLSTVLLTGAGVLFEGVKRIGSFDATGLLPIALASVLFAVAWQIVKSSGLKK